MQQELCQNEPLKEPLTDHSASEYSLQETRGELDWGQVIINASRESFLQTVLCYKITFECLASFQLYNSLYEIG